MGRARRLTKAQGRRSATSREAGLTGPQLSIASSARVTADTGIVRLWGGAINGFMIGGQEFYLDDVCIIR